MHYNIEHVRNKGVFLCKGCDSNSKFCRLQNLHGIKVVNIYPEEQTMVFIGPAIPPYICTTRSNYVSWNMSPLMG